LYNLGEQTYHEDKVEFEEKYPDRVAIDRFKPSALAQAGAGVDISPSLTAATDSSRGTDTPGKLSERENPV
jgi:hypothetical protein